MGWDLRVPSSLTSDVSAAWHQMELAGSNLFRFESNLSSPYPGTCFTSSLVEFGALIWSNLSESCRPAAAVTLKYISNTFVYEKNIDLTITEGNTEADSE